MKTRAGRICIFTAASVLLLALFIWGCWLMNDARAALTKTETTEALGWTLLTDTGDSAGIKETGSINVSSSYDTTLHIDVCAASAAAHEGTLVKVQISSEAGEDGSWTDLTSYVCLVGTFLKSDCNDTNSDETIYVTNPATGGLDHDGKSIIIYDTGTIANSQILYQIDNSGDAGDTITVLDIPDHATDTDCDVLTVDIFGDAYSAVSSVPVHIPLSASQARVIINNFYDNDGTAADVIARVRVTMTTAIQ